MNNLDATQLLAMVREIHLPEPPAEPSVWPMLVAAFVTLVAIAAVVFKRKQKRSTWASQACAKLKVIEEHRNPDALEQTASLLRRVALTIDNKKSVRQLSGKPWLRYLDQLFNTRYFTEGAGTVFGNAMYQQETQAPEQLFSDIRKLIIKRMQQQ